MPTLFGTPHCLASFQGPHGRDFDGVVYQLGVLRGFHGKGNVCWCGVLVCFDRRDEWCAARTVIAEPRPLFEAGRCDVYIVYVHVVKLFEKTPSADPVTTTGNGGS